MNILRFALICSCLSSLDRWIFSDSHWFAAVFLLWTGEYSQNRTDLQLFIYNQRLVNDLILALICNCLSSLERWIFSDSHWFAAVYLLWTCEYSRIRTDLQLFFYNQRLVNILILALICNCLSSLDRWIFSDSHWFAAFFLQSATGEYSHISTDLQLFFFFGLVNILRFALICSCFSTISDWWIFSY